ncbi:GNAT family N-acetyltransferase, partial [bacterium]|nr:GNAT family N-acetyltransferase [bacterium]
TNKFCPYLQLPDKIELIFNHHSEKTKNRFLSYVRSAFKNPSVRFQIGFIKDDPKSSLDYFTGLHLKRISSQGKFSNFSNQQFISFHNSYVQNTPDSVLFFWIIDHNTPIASTYCFIQNDAVYLYNSGFDPNSSVKKVGQILLYKMFEYLISRNIGYFYFLRGSEEYKYFWTSSQDELYYAEIFQSIYCRIFNSVRLRIHKK